MKPSPMPWQAMERKFEEIITTATDKTTAPLVNQMYNHAHDSRHYFCCVAFQWAVGVIPVLPYSGQNRHEAADTQYWLPEQCTAVPGAHGLPLWQVRN
jgi:hypothetical protein